ncbi:MULTISPECIES: LysR substrate-binding domain-containing protein [unclassified Janthinobacterium]|uniref:LysR substrate-binding domain-containing protein n=1 Tax=unclassified Janthinobacterium TaxID=2610881 RepID=UPI0009DA48A4|nr:MULTISPECIES: LysR substrate-binding domain-containing protein [unclassified Janthinobacterium]
MAAAVSAARRYRAGPGKFAPGTPGREAVATAGGITRAAAILHRVPSNISTRVKNLEDDIGAALFLRKKKRLQLTPAGKVLLDYARRLLALAQEAHEAVHDTSPRGRLRLGCMESTAAARLPALLAALQRRHPALAVDLRTGLPRTLAGQVPAGELDAALVVEPVADERLDRLPAFTEELVLVGPAGQAPIRSARDLDKRILLAFEPGCPHRQRLEDWCADAAVVPEQIIELGSYHAILGCCAAGMGVALMPRSVLATYTETAYLSVHALGGRFHSARTLLISRRGAPQGKIAAFADLLREGPQTEAPAQAAGAGSAAYCR